MKEKDRGRERGRESAVKKTKNKDVEWKRFNTYKQQTIPEVKDL